MSARSARHEKLSATLAASDDDELTELLDAGHAGEVGVGGGSSRIEVDGEPVFAKRIPLTDLELAAPHSTANMFALPLHCQYGIGSPGFTAWRELAANRIVTDAVLAGETASFPLLHHWRILPGRPAVAGEHANIDRAVAALGGDSAARARLEALATASCSLVLFSEYLPHALTDWLTEQPASKADPVERQLSHIVAGLRRTGLLHMDGHFGNMRTDGELIYLTDFGLATTPRFDLSVAEHDFVRHNATHDAGYAAMVLVNWLVADVCAMTPTNGGVAARNNSVRECAAGRIPADLPPGVAAILTRHAPAAATMNSFYWQLFGGDVRAEYPAQRMVSMTNWDRSGAASPIS